MEDQPLHQLGSAKAEFLAAGFGTVLAPELRQSGESQHLLEGGAEAPTEGIRELVIGCIPSVMGDCTPKYQRSIADISLFTNVASRHWG